MSTLSSYSSSSSSSSSLSPPISAPSISVVDCESEPTTNNNANVSASSTPPHSNAAPPPVKAALIVIDMQNDFVSGSLAVPDAQSIIEPINTLINRVPFTLRIATRDFHPDNHVSFAATHQKPVLSKTVIYHPDDDDDVDEEGGKGAGGGVELEVTPEGMTAKRLDGKGIEQTLWPIHCVAYTGGADFAPGLQTSRFDTVLHKGTHPRIESYSAFRDIWSRTVSELPAILDAKGITDVYFVGLAGDYCVKYSAIDAVEFGYRTWLVVDGIRSIGAQEGVMEALVKKGARRTTVREVGRVFGIDLDDVGVVN